MLYEGESLFRCSVLKEAYRVSSETKGLIAWDEWRRYGSIMPACLFGMVLVATHAYALGVMIVPLEKEFGWSRSQISAGPLVTSIATLLLAPIAGRALDRHGPRKIALIGVPTFAIAIALISTAGPSIVSWLTLYALLAIALLLVYPTVWTGAIAMRFEKNRGLAMAIALSGTGVTSAVVPFLASRLLAEFGWRGAYIALGIISFLVVFPLVLLLFDRDKIHHQIVEKASSSPHPGATNEFLSGRYVRLAAAALIYSVGATGLAINAVPILGEEGFTILRAAKIVGLIGVGTIIGRVLGGIALDVVDGRFVASGCGLAAVLSAGILLMTEGSPWAAGTACLFLGLAAGAEYDACAYLTTRYFPRRNFGALFGLIGALAGVGAGISPMIANAIYDVTGTYETVLWGIIPLFMVACLLFLSLGKYPQDVELTHVEGGAQPQTV
jgi:MFS family permease